MAKLESALRRCPRLLAPSRRLRATATLLFVAALTAQKNPTGAVERPPLGGELARALDATAADYWGTALVALENEVVFAGARGMQDRQKAPMTCRSLFDFGGTTTRLTTLATLVLLQQKKWKPDDAVARALTNWPADKSAMTFRHLMEQTSGLPGTVDWGTANQARRTALAAIAGSTLTGKPGAEYHWSDLNGVLLALIVEQASGADFEAFVQKRVLQPAGMNDAVFLGDRRIDARRVTWRLSGSEPAQPASAYDYQWAVRGVRGLLVTPYDVHAWCAALCAGKFADDAFLQPLLRPLAGGFVDHVATATHGGVEFVRVDGGASGYRSGILLHRPSRSWVVLLADERDLGRLEAALGTVLAGAITATATAGTAAGTPAPTPAGSGGAKPAEPPAPQSPSTQPQPPLPPGVALPPAKLQRFVGDFETEDGGRFAVRVEPGEPGRLVVDAAGMQVSARFLFGRWPLPQADAELHTAEDRGLALATALLAGEADAARQAFGDDAAASAATQLCAAVRREVGDRARTRYVGLEPGAQRASWFVVQGIGAPVLLRAVWADASKFAELQRPTTPPPFRLRFRVERADLASAPIAGVPASITIEGEGGARVLVYEDAGGIVEARWVADPR